MGMTKRECGAIFISYILFLLAAPAYFWYFRTIQNLGDYNLLNNQEYYFKVIQILLAAGIVAGTIIFGLSAELIGRKITLLVIDVSYIIVFTTFYFAKIFTVACIAQVICGMAIGGTLVVVPIYIAELADPSCRGALGALMAVTFNVSSVLFTVLGKYVAEYVSSIIVISFGVLFLVLFFFLGLETPFYYVKKNKSSHAMEIEEAKRHDHYTQDELNFIQNTKIMRCFGRTGWIKSIVLILILITIYHLSGVYSTGMLLFYVYEYFSDGLKWKDIDIADIIIMSYAFQVIGCIICVLLVDRLGRKACLMISTLGIAIISTPIAISMALTKYYNFNTIHILNVIFVVLFWIIFNIGIYPVTQVYLGEVFPFQFKTAAVAFLVSVQQVTIFAGSKFYSDITYLIGPIVTHFVLIAAMLIATGVIHFVFIETKRRSLQEIQLALKNK